MDSSLFGQLMGWKVAWAAGPRCGLVQHIAFVVQSCIYVVSRRYTYAVL